MGKAAREASGEHVHLNAGPLTGFSGVLTGYAAAGPAGANASHDSHLNAAGGGLTPTISRGARRRTRAPAASPAPAFPTATAVWPPVASCDQFVSQRATIEHKIGDHAAAPLAPGRIAHDDRAGSGDRSFGERRRRPAGFTLGIAFGAAAFLRRVDTPQPHLDASQIGRHVGGSVHRHGVAVDNPDHRPRVVGCMSGGRQRKPDNPNGAAGRRPEDDKVPQIVGNRRPFSRLRVWRRCTCRGFVRK